MRDTYNVRARGVRIGSIRMLESIWSLNCARKRGSPINQMNRFLALLIVLLLTAQPVLAGLSIVKSNGITLTGADGIDYVGINGITLTGADGIFSYNSNGITLTGADGITLTGADGVTSTGANGATYTGPNGITLTGADGITLTGADGITLTGADGITLTGADGQQYKDKVCITTLQCGIHIMFAPMAFVLVQYACSKASGV